MLNAGHPIYICEKCGGVLKVSPAKHIVVCAALPDAEEIGRLLDEKRTNTCSSIARANRTNMDRIRNILLRGDTDWTPKRLRQRGKAAKYIPQRGTKRGTKNDPKNPRIDYRRGRFDCADGCGMMVAKPGQVCQFCHFDKVGLSHYMDFIDLKKDDPRFKENEKVFFLPVRPVESPIQPND